MVVALLKSEAATLTHEGFVDVRNNPIHMLVEPPLNLTSGD